MPRKPSGLVVLSAKVGAGLAEQVRQLADRSDQTVSETVGQLLHLALTDGAGAQIEQTVADQGYQAGLRQGLAQVHQHMKKLFR